MSSNAVAIVGMACRYPDAKTPQELWENVLAQRKAFRRLPDERLRVDDYLSEGGRAADSIYSTEAAVIDGYVFDRLRFSVSGSTFRSTDLTHWLSLDVAAQALSDAGFPDGDGLPRETTGVILGNTLTGEFSRASVMRLRWPYVRRVVEDALGEEGWEPGRRRLFLRKLEGYYKQPFAPVTEDTLAGGLSNTIAGRVCNHFDLKGGGYTIDGACASSLLAVANACSALDSFDLDVVVAGGVDLSLDPFELVGFSKTGALAPEQMRVYDTRSEGFWPGEGCGFVVLMRYEDALAQSRRVYALIRGWGISSDGSGGMTRPEVDGQKLALRRAYRRAGCGVETVSYFEGHGTGTSIGDATELRALIAARREAGGGVPPAALSSIKAIIGHTKAAAGMAGLIKATMALRAQIVPPATGCEEPHPELSGTPRALSVFPKGRLWPAGSHLRAGVSAMGFGGINTHVVLEGVADERRRRLSARERILLSSAQDAELLLLDGDDPDELRRQVEHLLTYAARLSRAEVGDLAAALAKRLKNGRMRAALVVSSPSELAAGLNVLSGWLADGTRKKIDTRAGVLLGAQRAAPRIGFLFPGQGSPAYPDGGALGRRFEVVGEFYEQIQLPKGESSIATSIAQPSIVASSLATLRLLGDLGVGASFAIGHSLGELTALHWAGAMPEEALLRMTATRGALMGELGSPGGAMASIHAGRAEVEEMLSRHGARELSIAALNSPQQTVISGASADVAAVVAQARARGLKAFNLPVSHAFHSPLMKGSAAAFAEYLATEKFCPLRRAIFSTVTGQKLNAGGDLAELLQQQVTQPVRFAEAVAAAGVEGVDLWVEAGPGHVLSGLVAALSDAPAVSVNMGCQGLRDLLTVVGAAFVLGTQINHQVLFDERFVRDFSLDWRPMFLANPCESAPVPGRDEWPAELEMLPEGAETEGDETRVEISPAAGELTPLQLIKGLVSEYAELPASAIKDGSRLLSDLHLNSIAVGQLVTTAARRLGLPPPAAPTEYANVTVAEVARSFEELAALGGANPGDEGLPPPGVDSWVRTFTVELVERERPRPKASEGKGAWRVIAPSHPLADRLEEAFARAASGDGVVVCLPPEFDDSCVALLLQGAEDILARKGNPTFVLVQHGNLGAAFARALHLEAANLTTCVVDVPFDSPEAVSWVLAEAASATGYVEAHYDRNGVRREPVLKTTHLPDETGALPLGRNDVLLVTGGGKGITAECAFSLASETGARLALFGRSHPPADAELRANLERFRAAGVQLLYVPVDVSDAEAVRAAVAQVEAALGPVTALLHGAGRNVPQMLGALDSASFLGTLAPKVYGLRNLISAIDASRLRLLVTFGSIIARTGMRGQADYALANEWLARLTERFQREHPSCRCVAVEWSVWSGVGMGERLGRIEALAREGVTPITTDEGLAILARLLKHPLPEVSLVVAGRFGSPPTLGFDEATLPFLRFLERPRVFYPGVELVADSELTPDTDPYVGDHVFQGRKLLPAVMGLEAMAQAARALLKVDGPLVFEDVQFNRPVIVPESGTLQLRIAALAREPGCVEVVLRSGETAFQVNHFKAVCRHSAPCLAGGAAPDLSRPATHRVPDLPQVQLNPASDLYGSILFHEGRFRRLRGYKILRATQCLAEISPDGDSRWFSRYLPAELLLGDPAARDAAIHAVQGCIPHATILPTGVERLTAASMPTTRPVFAHARERWRKGATFLYDVEVSAADGSILERWEGLRLHAVDAAALPAAMTESLLGPYLERRAGELVPGAAVYVALRRDAEADSPLRTERAVSQAIGAAARILKRPDGRPELIEDSEAGRGHKVGVSVAHSGELTLAVVGPGPLGCDLEAVSPRADNVWRELLGEERFALARLVAGEMNEDLAVAATRVWTASECLKKAGAQINSPLVFVKGEGDAWVKLASGPLVILTYPACVRGVEQRVVAALLMRGETAGD